MQATVWPRNVSMERWCFPLGHGTSMWRWTKTSDGGTFGTLPVDVLESIRRSPRCPRSLPPPCATRRSSATASTTVSRPKPSPPAGTSCSARARALGICTLCPLSHGAAVQNDTAGGLDSRPFLRTALAASVRARRMSAAIRRRSARCWRAYLTTSKASHPPTAASSTRSRASASPSSYLGMCPPVCHAPSARRPAVVRSRPSLAQGIPQIPYGSRHSAPGAQR